MTNLYNNVTNNITNLNNQEDQSILLHKQIKTIADNYDKGDLTNIFVYKNITPEQLKVKPNNLGAYLLTNNSRAFRKVDIDKSFVAQYAINNGYKYYAISRSGDCYISESINLESSLKNAEIRYENTLENYLNSKTFNTLILGYNGTVYLCNYEGSYPDANGAPDKSHYSTVDKKIQLIKELLLTNPGSVIAKEGFNMGENSTAINCLTSYIGCYKDEYASKRALPNYAGHNYNHDTCHDKAVSLGYSVFGLQDGVPNSSQCYMGKSYDDAIQYGNVTNCKEYDGKMYGEQWSNAVYAIGVNNCVNSKCFLDNDGSLKIKKFVSATNANTSPTSEEKIVVHKPQYVDNNIVLDTQMDNALTAGKFLVTGDTMESENGKFKLVLAKDGNKTKIGLYKVTNEIDFINHYKSIDNISDSDIIEVTSIPNNGENCGLGKMAYEDEKGNLYSYPNSMLQNTASDNYIKLGQFSIRSPENWENEIDSKLVTQNINSACRTFCDSNDNCDGYAVYNHADTKNCILLTGKKYIMNNTIYNNSDFVRPDTDLSANIDPSGSVFLRVPSIAFSSDNNTCPTTALKFIDTVEWNSYTFDGSMTPNTKCSLGKLLLPIEANVATTRNNIKQYSNEISSQINELVDSGKVTNSALSTNINSVNNLIGKYKASKQDIEDIGGEGKFGSLQAHMDDSNLQLLSNNYQYILWTILAILIIMGAMKIAKR